MDAITIRLHTVDEVAAQTRLSASTIRRKCATGEIDSFRFGERAIRISEPELNAFLMKSRSNGVAITGDSWDKSPELLTKTA